MRCRSLRSLAMCLFLLAPAAAVAQETAGQLGVGVLLGAPFGVTTKYLLDARNAFDLAIGEEDGDLDFHVDVLTHFRDLFPQPSKGRLAPYLGLGIKIKDEEETLFGLRFPGGIAYAVQASPLEIFAEVAPVLRVAPSLDGGVDGGVGVRYYFSWRRPTK